MLSTGHLISSRFHKIIATLSAVSLVIIIDQLTKVLVRAGFSAPPPLTLIPNWLHVQHTVNSAGFLGCFSTLNNTPISIFILFTALFIPFILLLIYSTPATSTSRLVSLGLVLGGVVSNGIDRMMHGGVSDWLLIHTPFDLVFNIADIAIFAGIIWYCTAIFTIWGQTSNS